MLPLVSELLGSADPLFNYRPVAQRCCLFIANIDCSDGFAVITKSLIDQLQPFIAHQAKAKSSVKQKQLDSCVAR